MDDKLVENWNSIVKPDDRIIHLGDVCFNSEYVLPLLNGKKHLIKGNHDYNNINTLSKYFTIEPSVTVLKTHKTVLCHYPLYEWPHAYHGFFHMHGHCHGTAGLYNVRALDVGVDVHNFFPIDLEEALELIKVQIRGSHA
jgi:calcineurin-like phosphoesterase family protein